MSSASVMVSSTVYARSAAPGGSGDGGLVILDPLIRSVPHRQRGHVRAAPTVEQLEEHLRMQEGGEEVALQCSAEQVLGPGQPRRCRAATLGLLQALISSDACNSRPHQHGSGMRGRVRVDERLAAEQAPRQAQRILGQLRRTHRILHALTADTGYAYHIPLRRPGRSAAARESARG